MKSDRQPLDWMHRYAVLTATATFLLIIAGALVKSTGSGLSVPDWPLSFGKLMPEMVGGVFFEHSHRMVATFVGLLTIALVVWIRRREPRDWVRKLSTGALAIVLIQGCLGGLTVLLKLPPIVSIAHAGLAEIFFCVTVSLAFFTSRWWRSEERPIEAEGSRNLQVQCVGLTLVVYVQILLGALVRHYGAGLSIRDFPLSNGSLIPTIDSFYVGIHFAHRAGAWTVALLAAITAWRVRAFAATLVSRAGARDLRPLTRPAALLIGVVALQILLGGFIIWTERAVEMTTAHVATGAFTLVTSLLVTLAAFRALREPEPSDLPEAELGRAAA